MEVAEAASARLSRTKSESTRTNKDPKAALLRAGIARCADCRHPLVAINSTEKGALYRCNPTNRQSYGCPCFGIQARIHGKAVCSNVAARLKDPGMIAAEIGRLRRGDPVTENVAAVVRGLAEIERNRRDHVRRLADIDDDGVASLVQADLASLRQQAKQLRAERDALARMRQEWEQTRGLLADLEL